MFPWLLIAIGAAVLLFGSRMAVLGASIGALLGAGLLRLLPGTQDPWLALIIVGGLAILGGFSAGFMKGIINIVTLVLGAVGGVAIVLAVLDLFGANNGLIDWLLALIGGVVGIVLVRRFRRWAIILLAGLVGALLVMRGVQILLPTLTGPIASLLALVLAGGAIGYQGGLFGGRKPAAEAPASAAPPAAPAATTPPAESKPPSK